MIVAHDYRCDRCGAIDEVAVDGNAVPATVDCHSCMNGPYVMAVMRRIWLRAPAVHGDISPYFNTQLGCMVESKQHFDRILKERGKVALGPDEARRSQNMAHEPSEPELDKEKFRDAMEKSWADMQSGNIPLVEAKPLPDYIQPTKGLVS